MDKLCLRDVRHLGYALKLPPEQLFALVSDLCADEPQFYREIEHPKPNGGSRKIVIPDWRLKQTQKRIDSWLARLDMPESIHGARKKRSAITNALPHRFAEALVQTDIKDFFPSIMSGAVYEMFRSLQGCSPDVARALTRLTTFKGSLPQGAPTSPRVATLVLLPVVHRIEHLVKSRGGVASIYIDDITVSGVKEPRVVLKKLCRIHETSGQRAHPNKSVVVGVREEKVVTGVADGHGTADAPKSLVRDIRKAMRDLADGDNSVVDSLEGKIQHLKRLNPGSAKQWRRKLLRFQRNAESAAT